MMLAAKNRSLTPKLYESTALRKENFMTGQNFGLHPLTLVLKK